MYRKKLLILFILVTVNLFILVGLHFQERHEILKKGLNPDLVDKFDTITTYVTTQRDENLVPINTRVLSPPKIKMNQKYPLLIFLHGAGERGHDNVIHLKTLPQQMALRYWQEKHPCYLLAPQCPDHMRWSSLLCSAKGEDYELLDHINQFIHDFSSENSVDPNRIYITGYSMGGYGTWRMVSRYPDQFAAAAPICGGGDPKVASRCCNLPLWVVHGDADPVVPVSESRKMVNAIRKLGGTPEYHELKGVKHDSWSITYRNSSGMLDWLFHQNSQFFK